MIFSFRFLVLIAALTAVITTMFAGIAFAELPPVLPPDASAVPDASLWAAVVAMVTNPKGITVLAVAQAGALFLRSTYGNMLGVWRYFAILALSAVTELVVGLVTGQPLLAMLADGALLGLLQVALHQGFVQWKKAKEDSAAVMPVPKR